MQALWLENQSLSLRTVPIPTRSDEEEEEKKKNRWILIKILRAGICNTDLELIRGYYPYCGILGHEFVGIVVDGPPDLMNKRVVGEINITCLSLKLSNPCSLCQRGNSSHCTQRSVLGIVNHHGALTEYLTLPLANIYPLPDNISTDHGTFIEPLAAALEIQQQITITSNMKVLIIGDGKLGQLIAQTIYLTSCNLIVLGHHQEKLSYLSQRGIQTCTALPAEEKDTFDITIECTGNSSGFHTALHYVRPRGTIIMKSTYASNLNLDASRLVVNEITLLGSRCGPFDKAIDILQRGLVDVDYLIEAKYSLKDGLKAFEHAERKGTLKILLDME